MPESIAVGITGASGAAYALRLLTWLLQHGHPVQLLISKAGRIVLHQELDLCLPAQPAAVAALLTARFGAMPGQLQVYGEQDWNAPLASGSGAPKAMVIVPCTVGTLGAIASGLSDNLLHRAADVCLKERRKLVLVVRETPLSAIHLQNMLTLTHAGAVILPACPGFYQRPADINALIDFLVARILDQLGLSQSLLPRWGEPQFGLALQGGEC
jgi:4-hydroxy-3-polyprenylbenzoate decarboxylase